jgi:MFS family permease
LSGSLYFGGFLLGCFTVPRLVNVVGHIRVFTVLTATMTSAILGITLSNQLIAWLVLRLAMGWSIAGLYLVIESWLNEESTNERRGSTLSIYTMTALFSMAGGQLLLNFAEPGSDQLIVIAAVCIALAAVPVGLTRINQPSPIPSATFSPWLVMRTSRAASISSFIAGFVIGCFYTLGLIYGTQIGRDVGEISLMMAGGILGGAIFQWPLGRASDSVDRRIIIFVVMLAAVAICVVATTMPPQLVPFIFLLFGGCIMPIYSLSLAHAGDNVETSFLEVGTGILIMNAAGAAVGPIIASISMGVWGPQSFFAFCGSALTVGATTTFYFILKKPALRPHYSPFQLATTVAAQGAVELDPRSEQDVAESASPSHD